MRSLAIVTVGVATAVGGCVQRQSMSNLSRPVSNNATAATATHAYSFLGIEDPEDARTIRSLAHQLDLATGAWSSIADVPGFKTSDGVVRARIAANAFVLQGRVFLFGGYAVLEDGSEETDPRLLEYLPDSDAWIERTQLPVPVDDAVAGVWRDELVYVVSGWHGPIHDNVLAVQVYDPASDTWQQATPLPGPVFETGMDGRPAGGLFGHAGGVVGDYIVIIDGVRREPETRKFVISDAVYIGEIDPSDPRRIEWARLDAHPGRPTYRAASGVWQRPGGTRELVVLGGTDNPYNISGTGYNGEPSYPLAQLVSFDPVSTEWTLHDWPKGLTSTMDHRALAPVPSELGGGFLVIGGMIAPGEATTRVQKLGWPRVSAHAEPFQFTIRSLDAMEREAE